MPFKVKHLPIPNVKFKFAWQPPNVHEAYRVVQGNYIFDSVCKGINANDPTLVFVGGQCCPTLDFYLHFRLGLRLTHH